MVYYAHSGKAADKSDWQGLRDHLLALAERATEMARPFGLERAAYLAGLTHDLGKYTVAFQRYIEGRGSSIDHSTAGAFAMLGDLATGVDRSIAQLIAYCIAGHHAGLPDWLGETAACLTRRLEGQPAPLDPVWRTELPVDAGDLVPKALMANFSRDPQRAAFQFSVMTRMLFSCLVDAGAWIETAAIRKVMWRFPSPLLGAVDRDFTKGDGATAIEARPSRDVDTNASIAVWRHVFKRRIICRRSVSPQCFWGKLAGEPGFSHYFKGLTK
ncbi:CRISPR-associated endonuclease Cas3'' [Rhizobium sp. RU36D]|uniref:CRISPR-associated endonuclease Cas3'' n=1 Tax=Rhizobium sp. RU36D TaxID=1907415 RepID=UPI0009D7A034|nr:CRISPR-associated endonuclease Cas3'' [Rhizobium sp. RU36D]SMD13212.1 CRISPR-associated endonuclease Cas3-HD [Rhizobium sp. RU36D]